MLAVAGMGAAAGAAELSREESLEALKSSDRMQRRQGADRLALAGQMEDVSPLLGALGDPDTGVRNLAERSIWNIWGRSGDPEIDRLFEVGLEQMQGQEYLEAIETFSEIIRKKPDFAEGWNKRATLYYMIGALEKSLADCDEVIKRNPVHFGALAGYGLIYLRLDRPALALQYFERALAVNPNMAQIETAAEELRRQLGAPRGDRL
jgi:tetratricopeptide (TPR) repeat protein